MSFPMPPLSLTDMGTATSGINGAPVIQWGSPFAVGSNASATADNQARATASGDPAAGTGIAGMPEGGGGGMNWMALAVAAGVVGIAYLISR